MRFIHLSVFQSGKWLVRLLNNHNRLIFNTSKLVLLWKGVIEVVVMLIRSLANGYDVTLRWSGQTRSLTALLDSHIYWRQTNTTGITRSWLPSTCMAFKLNAHTVCIILQAEAMSHLPPRLPPPTGVLWLSSVPSWTSSSMRASLPSSTPWKSQAVNLG